MILDFSYTAITDICHQRLNHGWSSHHFSILGRVAPLCNYKSNTNKLLNNHKKEHILIKLQLELFVAYKCEFLPYVMYANQDISSNYFLQSPIM